MRNADPLLPGALPAIQGDESQSAVGASSHGAGIELSYVQGAGTAESGFPAASLPSSFNGNTSFRAFFHPCYSKRLCI